MCLLGLKFFCKWADTSDSEDCIFRRISSSPGNFHLDSFLLSSFRSSSVSKHERISTTVYQWFGPREEKWNGQELCLSSVCVSVGQGVVVVVVVALTQHSTQSHSTLHIHTHSLTAHYTQHSTLVQVHTCFKHIQVDQTEQPDVMVYSHLTQH